MKETKKHNDIGHYRKSYDYHSTATFHIDGNILARLQELETELNDVKSLAKNDTDMIKKLKSSIKLNKNNPSKENYLAKVILSSSEDKKVKNLVLENGNNKQVLTDDKTKLRKHNDNNHNIPINHSEKHHDLVFVEEQKNIRRSGTSDGSKFNVVNLKGLSNEDTNLQDSSNIIPIKNKRDSRNNSDKEGDITPNIDKFEYKTEVDKVLNSDSLEDMYDKFKNSRRTMVDKVEKIRNELDGVTQDGSSNKQQHCFSSYTKIDFEKEYIPDKETFSKNMKTLESLLSSNKN